MLRVLLIRERTTQVKIERKIVERYRRGKILRDDLNATSRHFHIRASTLIHTARLLAGTDRIPPNSFERVEQLHTRLFKIPGVASHKRQVVAQCRCRDLQIGDRLCHAFLLQFRRKAPPFMCDR